MRVSGLERHGRYSGNLQTLGKDPITHFSYPNPVQRRRRSGMLRPSRCIAPTEVLDCRYVGAPDSAIVAPNES